MVNRNETIAGVSGFVAGAVTGYAATSLVRGSSSNYAVALVNTVSSPGLVAPSYNYPLGSVVQLTVFAASNSSSQPTSVQGFSSTSSTGPFTGGQVFTWSPSTGNAFTFNYGAIDSASHVYTYFVVGFSDGSTVKTNTLFVQVGGG
ncbi:MAG: hypothetical protein QXO47_10075 [Thermoproteota archaeon]